MRSLRTAQRPPDRTNRSQSLKRHVDEDRPTKLWPCSPASVAGKNHESDQCRFGNPAESTSQENALDPWDRADAAVAALRPPLERVDSRLGWRRRRVKALRCGGD